MDGTFGVRQVLEHFGTQNVLKRPWLHGDGTGIGNDIDRGSIPCAGLQATVVAPSVILPGIL